MTDTDTATQADPATPAVSTLLTVPIVKGKSTVSIDTSDLPDEVYAEALALGLKELVNRGMSKLTKASTKNDEELKSLAMAQAEKNVEAIKSGKIKFAGRKAASSGRSQAVNTEALRLAKALVKDGIKAAGMKISLVKASEITTAAKVLLGQDNTLYDKAEANLAERTATPVKIDIKSLIKEDAGLKAKAAEEKAKKPISKTQAGKVKPRAKPTAQPTAH